MNETEKFLDRIGDFHDKIIDKVEESGDTIIIYTYYQGKNAGETYTSCKYNDCGLKDKADAALYLSGMLYNSLEDDDN